MYYGIDQLSDCSYLIKKPLADKMNADTGHNGWLVLEAHGGFGIGKKGLSKEFNVVHRC